MNLVSILGITKTYQTPLGPVHAVNDLSLDIVEGECLAIVGESGSGKTTLANMLLGILPSSTGEIKFRGRTLPARRLTSDRQAIQLVQQNPLSSLNPKRTVGASVRLGLDTYNIGISSQRWKAVEEALIAVGLEPEMRKRFPASLSGGQRQRVGIARALVCEPQLLVLDEPTSALDVLVQARVLRLLNKLRTERGLTYMFITHDLVVVRNIAERVAVFRSGKLVELGDTEKVFTTPEHSYTRQLIGSIPVLDENELLQRDTIAMQL